MGSMFADMRSRIFSLLSQSALGIRVFALAALVLAALAAPRAARATVTIRYVAPGGMTSGLCDTWGNACSLQFALSVAASGDEVWVKAGLYTPIVYTDSLSRLFAFNVPSGVAVYGGFVGTETLLSQRNAAAHVTILSGDIDGDDSNGDGNHIDEVYTDIQNNNSYHVVVMDGSSTAITSSTVLDGFTITGGKADGSNPQDSGGGLLCYATGSTHESSPTLSNLTFSGNGGGAFTVGGALATIGDSGGSSSPTLTNVTFSGNNGTTGGAVASTAGTSGTSSPVFHNVTFRGNSAADGGAISSYASGAGAVGSPEFTNVTFSGNSATGSGGAVQIAAFAGGTGSPAFTNVILWGDAAGSLGPEMFLSGATPTMNYSIEQGGYAGSNSGSFWGDGAGNLDADPKLYPLGKYGGSIRTMTLQKGSPAIDKGTNTGCPATDARGFARPKDGDGNGTKVCDMGATESGLVSTTLQSTGTYDGWVLETGENTNAGGAHDAAGLFFRLGDDAANKQYRAVLSFNTTLPAAATLTSVTLRIRKGGLVGSSPFASMGNITVDIKKGLLGGLAALQNSDFQAGVSKSSAMVITNSPTGIGWYSKALASSSFGFINKTGVTQFRLRFAKDDNNNHVADYLAFYSGNAASPSRPVLVIKYYSP